MNSKLFSCVGWGALLLSLAAAAPGCSKSFARASSGRRVSVTLVGSSPGSPTARIPISTTETKTLRLNVEVLDFQGNRDTSFNGYLRASIKPGTIVSVSGPGASGRNVRIENGVAENVDVNVLAAYGDARIWFEDIGYDPADPRGETPPKCANGVDDNNNGTIDFPADPGCAFANDNDESSGTYATGSSDIIYFSRPRISDIRGAAVGGTYTPFPFEALEVDTGWDGNADFVHSVVVTRIASDGFYLTDLSEDRGSNQDYASIFAFTFNPPPNLRICDRLKIFAGTAVDFYGFTEMNYPTWLVEEWDPRVRDCMVPEPRIMRVTDAQSTPTKFKLVSSFVRLATEKRSDPWVPDVATLPDEQLSSVFVAANFGPERPTAQDNYMPGPGKSNCDLDGDGKVDYTVGTAEKVCSDNCARDNECSEYSNYVSRRDFMISFRTKFYGGVWNDTYTSTGKMQVNAAVDTTFVPLDYRDKPVRSFSGTMRYFSGSSLFTIEARCPDDIVLDLSKAPLASNKACVTVRSGSANNEGSH